MGHLHISRVIGPVIEKSMFFKVNSTYNFAVLIVIIDMPQHVEGDSTKLVKDMKKIIVALLYIL